MELNNQTQIEKIKQLYNQIINSIELENIALNNPSEWENLLAYKEEGKAYGDAPFKKTFRIHKNNITGEYDITYVSEISKSTKENLLNSSRGNAYSNQIIEAGTKIYPGVTYSKNEQAFFIAGALFTDKPGDTKDFNTQVKEHLENYDANCLNNIIIFVRDIKQLLLIDKNDKLTIKLHNIILKKIMTLRKQINITYGYKNADISPGENDVLPHIINNLIILHTTKTLEKSTLLVEQKKGNPYIKTPYQI
ncbi:MAG: hypothetical protein RSB72_00180 [Bacilli bacterium]